MIAQIVFKLPLLLTFEYEIADNQNVKIGYRVIVSFRNKLREGIIVSIQKTGDLSRKYKLKPVIMIPDNFAVITLETIAFSRWIADYYLCSWGEILFQTIPAGIKIQFKQLKKRWSNPLDKKLFTTIYHFKTSSNQFRKGTQKEQILSFLSEHKTVTAKTISSFFPNSSKNLKQLLSNNLIQKSSQKNDSQINDVFISSKSPVLLTQEQKKVASECQQVILKKEFKTFLLHGVTSSGKTEVYLYLIWVCLQQQKTSLLLLPEISMIPQNIKKFEIVFNKLVIPWHSGLSDTQKTDSWLKIKEQKFCVIIGTRSALFSPFNNLGLIIVDEEHDGSFKQWENPSYNGRDIAVKLGQSRKLLVLLGSATPSVESYYNSELGKYKLLQLKTRYGDAQIPKVKIIDLKSAAKFNAIYYFSQELYNSLQDRLEKKEQSIIFLNRRGYAPLVICKQCEQAISCPNCSVILTWHKKQKALLCHYCHFTIDSNIRCTKCNHQSFRFIGLGTQQLEQTISNFFPQARVTRFDSDSFSNIQELNEKIQFILDEKVDIIVGTQILSKGHHFPKITFACVLLTDMLLNFKHYKNSEICFQLLSQLAGRTGRTKANSGNVLIQTYNPTSPILRYAVTQNYDNFYNYEIEKRKVLEEIPFIRAILVQVSTNVELLAEKAALEVVKILKTKLEKHTIIVLGPTEAIPYKSNTRFCWEILLQSKNSKILKSKTNIIYQTILIKKNYRVKVIVDP